MNKHVYLCPDSVEGIFTGVYDAWASQYGHTNTQLQIQSYDYNAELFCDYIPVDEDYDKASKVARTIQRQISPLCYQYIVNAALSYDSRKADAIYRVIILGLHMGSSVMNHFADLNVSTIDKLSRNVSNELLHLQGFLRFQELDNGILYATIHPKNYIIRYLGEHFADRFPDESFLIADTQRGCVIAYANQQIKYFDSVDMDFSHIDEHISRCEEMFQSLWKRYVEKIAIEPRKNLKLQQQMLPLRFRDTMPEFQ